MKYAISKEMLVLSSRITVYRIRALIPIPRHNVKVGDLGGYVQHKGNLSQDGDSWLADTSMAYEQAWVYENALLAHDSTARGKAKINGHAKLSENATVRDFARVAESAEISGYAEIYESARVQGNAKVYGNAKICGHCTISGSAKVFDFGSVRGRASVSDNASVYESAKVLGDSIIKGTCQVCGNVTLRGELTHTAGLIHKPTAKEKEWVLKNNFDTKGARGVLYVNPTENAPIKPPKRTKKAAISAAKKHLLTQFDDEGLM